MQEECLRIGEKDLVSKHFDTVQRPIFEVEDCDSDEDVTTKAEGTRIEYVDRNNSPECDFITVIDGVEEADSRCLKIVHQNFRNREGNRRDSRETDLRRGDRHKRPGVGHPGMDGLMKRKKKHNETTEEDSE
ncbi:Hypothetical predicted protein [Mytilus galloprovincialis]|uniref:Uncharacterized protein n=1 Tax=Mytilus galloprovincialis TaxID=29158 RepID=A0A8B6F092_MYTGA|nr:Hypothetical predicted protein [Mytilus galloprovincialis]